MAMMPTRAGNMRDKVGFYRPITQSDGIGGRVSKFATMADFTASAQIRTQRGTGGLPLAGAHPEKMVGGGERGTQLVNVTVRQSSNTRQVNTAWKLRDERDGTDYNIRSKIDPDRGTPSAGIWFELLCETGVGL